MSKRQLIRVQKSEAVTDGDGVKIQRIVARRALHTFDPLLLLDEIVSDDAADYIGGFPKHPHRGFETVTYMLEGAMKHRDHLGNTGLLQSGGVQWMTAGRGVIHSEMPQQKNGRLHGFQLWINLPAKLKMTAPSYREYQAHKIPLLELEGNGSVRLIAGQFELNGKILKGPVKGVSVQPDFMDIHLHADTDFVLPVKKQKRVLIYVYEGSLNIEGRQLQARQLGMLDQGEVLALKARKDTKFLLLAARPIKEPVVNWGPFVMNTRREIEQAISDLKNNRLV